MYLFQSPSANHYISRFNTSYHVGSGYLAATAYPGATVTYVKDYNNTIVGVDWQAAENPCCGIFNNNSTQGAFLNDLMYNDVNPSGSANPYYIVDSTALTGFSGGHNLSYDSTCAPSCTVTGRQSTDPGNINNINPLLVNPISDFHLQPSSPAIAAGTNLTTASGSGSSTTLLTVADAAYFQDGWGIPGVSADWIRIGASTTVQISSINYSTNVITLASAVSWNNNDPIYLYKDSRGNVVLNGANPNIGTTFDPAVWPPRDLTALVN